MTKKSSIRLLALLVIISYLVLGFLITKTMWNDYTGIRHRILAKNVSWHFTHNHSVESFHQKELVRNETGVPSREPFMSSRVSITPDPGRLHLNYEPDNSWKEWGILLNAEKVETRKKYKHTRFNIQPFDRKDTSSSVCLATQTTLNFMHHIIEVAESWKGKMSVAVYVPGLEFTRTKIMLWLLHQCTNLSSFDVSFTLVFPSKQPTIDNLELWKGISTANCSNMEHIGDRLRFRNDFLSYPQNLMRNIAREACGTEYVILSDNDMIPTPGLSSALLPILQEQRDCKKCAFVIPVYELEDSVQDLPENKTQLLKLITAKKAQAFHWKFWKPNQGSHDPPRWEKMDSSDGVKVAYPILKYQLYYEPIYVAKTPLPLFNEGFTGYGFTRNSQVFEMIMDGYRFFVLDNAFFRHRGVKPVDSNPLWRQTETNSNFEVFVSFAKNLLQQKNETKVLQEMKKRPPEVVLPKYVGTIDNFH